MTRHETFVVRARLGAPISLNDPIPFEGILFDVRYTYDPSTKGTPLAEIEMDRGVYRASVGILVSGGLAGPMFDTRSVTKRIDLKGHAIDFVDMSPDVPRSALIIGEMSPYRPKLTDHPVISNVTEVIWQVRGDRTAVERMVRDVPSIGRLRNRGLGTVTEWSFEECDAPAADAGWYAGGRILRRLPEAMVMERLGSVPDRTIVREAPLDPPFWDPGKPVRVAIPTLRALIMTRREAKAFLSM